MTLPDLVLRDVVAARLDSVSDTFDRKVFRNEQHVHHDGETRAVRVVDEVQLRRM